MESKKRVDFWRSTGAISTERECSAVFTVGKLRGLKAGAILAVDGNLVKKTIWCDRYRNISQSNRK